MTIYGEETRLEDLYPAARELFEMRREWVRRRPALRWLMLAAAAGVAVVAGRWMLYRLDRNL